MILIGETNKRSYMKCHVDKDDVISCILTLGNPVNGGATKYYDGKNAKQIGKNILQVLV